MCTCRISSALDVGIAEDVAVDDDRNVEVGSFDYLLELRPPSWMLGPLWDAPAFS
jgi:hypothetical protein